jgi:hypothetical protein
MLTADVSAETARQIELAETNAWADQWAAFREEDVKRLRLGITRVGEVVVLTSPVILFSHFNCVQGLGLAKPATEAELDEILALFRDQGIGKFLVHYVPLAQPAALPDWLAARGLRPVGGWDRVFRDAGPLSIPAEMPAGMAIEKVSPETAEEWADFLVGMYRLDPAKPLLLALVGRNGWHHYTLREDGRIVAARSMYIHGDGDAWWGIEAPVPGFMTQRFDLDFHLCREILQDGLSLGAKRFVADVEKVDPGMGHDGYRNFARLGFQRAYLRTNHGF